MSGYQKQDLFQAALVRLRSGLQLHLKLPPLHTQALHGLGDGGGQFGRGLLAHLRNFARLGCKSCLRLLCLGQQMGAVGSGVQLRQFVFPSDVCGSQFLGAAFVAPRQGHPQCHARIKFGQLRRVQFHTALVGAQAMYRVFHLRYSRGQYLGRALEVSV